MARWDDPLIPRPEASPLGLGTALARVAPHRLPEFHTQLDEAIVRGVRIGSAEPIEMVLQFWRATLEVARFPSEAARYRASVHAVKVLTPHTPGWDAALDDIAVLTAEAWAAVRAADAD